MSLLLAALLALAPCLPAGLPAEALSSPQVGQRGALIWSADGPVQFTLSLHRHEGRLVELGWARGQLVWVGTDPEGETPGRLNEQWIDPEGVLRAEETGPCRWRPANGGQRA